MTHKPKFRSFNVDRVISGLDNSYLVLAQSRICSFWPIFLAYLGYFCAVWGPWDKILTPTVLNSDDLIKKDSLMTLNSMYKTLLQSYREKKM